MTAVTALLSEYVVGTIEVCRLIFVPLSIQTVYSQLLQTDQIMLLTAEACIIRMHPSLGVFLLVLVA